MISKKDFNEVWQNASRDVILNQFYYDHTESRKEIERLNKIIEELRIKNNNLLEDNRKLRKEINLHSGKLIINELEVKTIY